MTGDIDKIKGIKQELPTPKKLEDTRDPAVFREKYLKVGEAEEEQKHDPKKNKKSKQAEEEKDDQKKIAAPEGPQADVAFRDVVSGADLETSELDATGGTSAKRTLGSSREQGAASGKSAYAPTISEEEYWGSSSTENQYEETAPPPPAAAAAPAPPPPAGAPPEQPPAAAPPSPPPAEETPSLPAEPPPVNAAPPGEPQQQGQPPPEEQPPEGQQGGSLQGAPLQKGEDGQPISGQAPEKKAEKGAVDELMLGELKPKKMTLKQKRFIAKQKKLKEAQLAKQKEKPDQIRAKSAQKPLEQMQAKPAEVKPEQVDKASLTGTSKEAAETNAPLAAAAAYGDIKKVKISEHKGPTQTGAVQKEGVSGLETGKREKDQDKGDQEREDQQDAEIATATRALGMEGITPISGFDTAVPGVESTKAPARALMSNEMEQIINRCAGVITVMKTTGQTTTTVQVSIPGSVFDGSHIVLTQSDTARGSFNLQFQGTPEAIALFNQNVADLAAALQGRRFEVNILSPELTKKYRASYRVQSAKDKGEK